MDYLSRSNEVRDRVNALLREKKITQNQVAAGDTAAQKRINSQLSHGANITLVTVLRVLDACPDVSADWLLRGSGDICSSHITGANTVTGRNATVIGQQQASSTGVLSEDFVRDMLLEKDKQIQVLLGLLGQK